MVSLDLLELVEILEQRVRVTTPDEDTGQISALAELTPAIHRLPGSGSP
ncbi:hypothetical protein IMZ11_39405 [Microtetraspora sp. AC03309]|nr:hypothetical protein [Microtetraspora sp. AC03309]MCC5581686.1 hypothetical protein [Microtetraspora sp. AC03309]